MANSSYFGLPGKIEDARQAIIYLGMAQVVDLVLLVSCSESFAGAHEGYGLDSGALWKSAVSAAIIATDLAESTGIQPSSRVFTGALLRDIGKVVLNQHDRSALEAILDCAKKQALTFREAELRVLGFDHAQIGAMLAQKWHFPPALQCIIRHYHIPLEAEACVPEASIVYLADSICRKMEIGTGIDDPFYMDDDQVIESLGLREADIEGIITGFSRKMERVNTLFEAA